MKKKEATKSVTPIAGDFAEVVQLIESARKQAYQAVNTTLIELYWQVGAYISNKIKAAEWGDAVVKELASHLALTQPNLKGFTQRNLFRMRQFYEAYCDNPIVSALLTQLPWTHNLIILSQSKRPEEREFYLRMAIQERWGKRELERQFNAALFARIVLNPVKVSPAVTQSHPEALNVHHPARTARHPAPILRHPAPILRHPAPILRHPAPILRHPREGGDPVLALHQKDLDSRLRGNDGEECGNDGRECGFDEELCRNDGEKYKNKKTDSLNKSTKYKEAAP